MASNIPYQIISKKPFFLYDNEDICKWIQSINLEIYLNKFKENKISGADVCLLNNEDLKTSMEITNIHDRYSILREIKKLMNSKIKFTLNFENNKVSINLDFDVNITLEKIFPLICNVLGLSKSVWDRVIIENNDRELICGYCKIFELIVLYPNKYLNLHIRLIEKGKNINFNNCNNNQQTDYDIKSSKSIHSAKIDYNIEPRINFRHSSSDLKKLNFNNNKIYEINNEKIPKLDQEERITKDNLNENERDYYRDISQMKSFSSTNEFHSNLRKPQELYSNSDLIEISKKEINTDPYNHSDNNNYFYRNNTNPNLYEIKEKNDRESDLKFRREYKDNYIAEKKSRPLSVNNYSSKYLKREEDEIFSNVNIKEKDDRSNKHNQNIVEDNYVLDSRDQNHKANKRLDLERKYSTSKNNFSDNINFTSISSNKAHYIPETNLNYDISSYKKFDNIDNEKFTDNLEYKKHQSYNFSPTEGNIKQNISSDLNIINRLDDVIDISKYNNHREESNNYKNESKYNNNNINNYHNNKNFDLFNNQSNPSKARYFSEKRMFREKKDDQKNLINNLKKYQQEQRNLKNNTDSFNNNSTNLPNQNSSNYIASNMTRSSNYIDNYKENIKEKDSINSFNKNSSNTYKDPKAYSERDNPSLPIGIHKDTNEINRNKKVSKVYMKNEDSSSIKHYKENMNIISERYGIERNSNNNNYNNKDERRNYNDYSDSKNSNKDLHKFEISKATNNGDYGLTSTTSNRLEKNAKFLEKIKFSNANNLEFFNQKYHK